MNVIFNMIMVIVYVCVFSGTLAQNLDQVDEISLIKTKINDPAVCTRTLDSYTNELVKPQNSEIENLGDRKITELTSGGLPFSWVNYHMLQDMGMEATKSKILSMYFNVLYSPEKGNYRHLKHNIVEFGTDHVFLGLLADSVNSTIVTLVIYDDTEEHKVEGYMKLDISGIVPDPNIPYNFELKIESLVYNYGKPTGEEQLKGEGHIVFKSWGANLVCQLKFTHVKNNENSTESTYFTRFYGGQALETTYFHTAVSCLLFVLPMLASINSALHFLDLMKPSVTYLRCPMKIKLNAIKDEKFYESGFSRTVSLTGVIFTSNMIFMLICIDYSIARLNLNIEQGVLVFFFNEVGGSITGLGTVCMVPFAVFSKRMFGNNDSVVPSIRGPFVFCIAYAFMVIIGLLYMGSFIFNGIYMHPRNYLLISNVYWINIIGNTIAKKTISDSPLSIGFNGVFLGLYPMTFLGPSMWIDGFDAQWLFTYIVLQTTIIFVITLQLRFGSRFFLPSKLRTAVYDKFSGSLRDSKVLENDDECNLCMNALYEPALEYSDSVNTSVYHSVGQETYYTLPCNHKFHPTCILRRLDVELKCPKGSKPVPENRFQD